MENNEFIKDINFKEKLLLDFLQTDIPKYVSHYTGAEAATSIIKTHKLCFTLASTFSDFIEGECFHDLIEDIIRSDTVFKDFYMAYIEVKNNIKKKLYIYVAFLQKMIRQESGTMGKEEIQICC